MFIRTYIFIFPFAPIAPIFCIFEKKNVKCFDICLFIGGSILCIKSKNKLILSRKWKNRLPLHNVTFNKDTLRICFQLKHLSFKCVMIFFFRIVYKLTSSSQIENSFNLLCIIHVLTKNILLHFRRRINCTKTFLNKECDKDSF